MTSIMRGLICGSSQLWKKNHCTKPALCPGAIPGLVCLSLNYGWSFMNVYCFSLFIILLILCFEKLIYLSHKWLFSQVGLCGPPSTEPHISNSTQIFPLETNISSRTWSRIRNPTKDTTPPMSEACNTLQHPLFLPVWKDTFTARKVQTSLSDDHISDIWSKNTGQSVSACGKWEVIRDGEEILTLSSTTITCLCRSLCHTRGCVNQQAGGPPLLFQAIWTPADSPSESLALLLSLTSTGKPICEAAAWPISICHR